MDRNRRILVVSNRLPIKITHRSGQKVFVPSEGGLATGLGSIYKKFSNNLWLGWPGAVVDEAEKESTLEQLMKKQFYPVFLSAEEIAQYYDGFSNATLWPLFHYFPNFTRFHPDFWEAYHKVNRKFATAILDLAKEDDIIWIQDYQLMLVPGMIREALPQATIGYFQHIPFPSYEIFRQLPWRKELIEGLMGSDLIGFHTYDDLRHFISAASRINQINGPANELIVGDRAVTVDAFPMSIDFDLYHQLAASPATQKNEQKLKKLVNHNRLLISIDRLDYSKGIVQRLQAFQILLEQHPELKEKISFIQLVVPSRDKLPKYRELKEEINNLVGEINGRFSVLGWQPIQHFYRSFPLSMLSALYKAADLALVTPLRDGMNLVSKEFVASKTDKKGVLVLSEMAGAARELTEAVLVNPNDIWTFAEKIYEALQMPEQEQIKRMESMQETISQFNVFTWASSFMDRLDYTDHQQKSLTTRQLGPDTLRSIHQRYSKSRNRQFFLDYDGTLTGFHRNINDAQPDAELKTILKALSEDKRNLLVITSGRDYRTMERWLGALPIAMVAEHGAWIRNPQGEWTSQGDLDQSWMKEIRPVLENYRKRTKGSFIEEKTNSLVWHYRGVEPGLGEIRAQGLASDIHHFVNENGLQLLEGHQVLEIKDRQFDKGKAIQPWLADETVDFRLAIGDDRTDEDMFKVLPKEAMSIKVGKQISAAQYYLRHYTDVRSLLRSLSDPAPVLS